MSESDTQPDSESASGEESKTKEATEKEQKQEEKRDDAKQGSAGKMPNLPETAAQPNEAVPAKKRKRGRVGFSAFVRDWNNHHGGKTPNFHYRIADWLGGIWHRRRKSSKRLLLLAFRGAGKSTLAGLFAAYLLMKNPDLRILTLSADLALARKMVRNVKRVVEKHPAIKEPLKPRKPELWGSEQFTVRRTAELRDPSMLARGIDGNFTGSRADVVICDDVEVPGNSDTPAKRAALREKLGEIEFVLVPGGVQLYLGTPHSYYSIYAEEPRAEIGETRPFLDGFERNSFPIRDEAGLSAWPRRFGEDDIAAIERASGPIKFASQMLLQPVAPDRCRFDAAKLLRYDREVELREAQGRASLWLEGRKLMSLQVWWDPAFGRPDKGDRNAIAAVYQDAAGHYWLHRLEYFTHDPALALANPEAHAEADQLCRKAAAFAHALAAPAIAVEDNGIAKFIPSLLRKALREIDPGIAVVAHHARAPKDERILAAFDVTLAGGLLHAHAGVFATPFVEELRGWRPDGKSGQADDGLDAVAGAILAEPVRLGPYPRAPSSHGAWRDRAQVHKAVTEFDP